VPLPMVVAIWFEAPIEHRDYPMVLKSVVLGLLLFGGTIATVNSQGCGRQNIAEPAPAKGPLRGKKQGDSPGQNPVAQSTKVNREAVSGQPTRRTTTPPGSVIPDKSAELYAKVSGYLKEFKLDRDGKSVDIGSRVEKDQVLAVIDMPELVKEVDRDRAALKRANSTVAQMSARVTTAEAEFKAAESMLTFRTKVHARLAALERRKVMDMRVVDEKEEQMHAAEETKNAAAARILQAEADLEEALAEVELAQAALERAQVDLDYATIRSPYEGVITVRNFWPGDFVRAADLGGSKPLLAVQKTDVMRVVVDIPHVDVPFVNPGNEARLTINNLPGMEFRGKVSRIAVAEDPVSRTMRAEIDLDNATGKLREGMYGTVTIDLDRGGGERE
jgi:HlyD family secretion protein